MTYLLDHSYYLPAALVVALTVGSAHAQDEETGSAVTTASSSPHIAESQSFFNGSASYSHTIDLPAGTKGVAPRVALTYGSQAKWSNTGYGWSISGVDAIGRSTKCGVPALDDTDVFVWRGQDLAPDADGVYHTQRESFARIERVGTGASSSWLVTTPNGWQYRYGATVNSRIMTHENADVVHRWALDRVEDPNGNYYTIVYTHDDASANYYPQTITYTMNDDAPLAAHRTVRFAWEPRPDVRTSYEEGTRRTTALRLANIEVRVHDTLHSRHELDYTLGAGGKSLLGSIRVVGSDGATSLSPTSFEYGQGERRFGEVISYGSGIGMYAATSHNGATKMLTDINGDGLTDEVARPWFTSRREAVPFQVRLGTVDGGFADAVEWDAATVSAGITNTTLHKDHHYSSKLMMDMDGDGRPDLVERKPAANREPGNYQVYLNTGAGFASAADWGPGEGRYVMDTQGRENTVKRLLDMNGDGLPDELYRPYQPRVTARPGRRRGQEEKIHNLQVRLNMGAGFGEPQDWGSMQALYLGQTNGNGVTLHELLDINGDGLSDDVFRAYDHRDPNQATPLLVRLNTGSGFGPVEDWGPLQGAGLRESRAGTAHDLIDINGDGLVDNVYRKRQTRSRGYTPLNHYLVRLNTGSGFGPVQSWGTGLGSTLDDSHNGRTTKLLTDINGDGLPDDVYRAPGTRLISSARRNVPYAKDYEVRLNQAGPPALLTAVQLPTGGRIKYEYGVSTQFDNTDYTGTPRLANKIWVVTQFTRDDALGGVSTTQISYRGGLYEGFPKCEFRGFREVTVTDPTGADRVSTYLQDDACWGHANSTTQYSAAGALLLAKESEWAYRDIDADRGIVFPYVETSRRKLYDGADTPKVTEKHYTYDDFGNSTEVVDRGDVAVDGDEIRTRTEYAINTVDWLVRQPSRRVVEDNSSGAWSVARETLTYYDNAAHGTVSRGNVTRVDAWLVEDRYATTTTGHDSYGNVVWTRDANSNAAAEWPVNRAGHTTDTTYDDVFHTVVIEKRNALDHITRQEYDALLRPVATVDANGHRATTAYDALGRPVSLAKPGDSEPTMTTEYVYDGVAPEYKIEHTHTTGDQWLTRYAFVDGFGRAIQDKVPVEGGFIASDRFYDDMGRLAATSQSYATSALVSGDPAHRITGERPLVLLGNSFANVVAKDDGTLSTPGWARVGEGSLYYGETGAVTPPSGVNGATMSLSGDDRTDRAVVLGDTDVTVGMETEVDLSDWNGQSLVLAAQYGAEYTVHEKKTSCGWGSGGKQCRTSSEHIPVDKPVMLTVTDADSGNVLVETELPYATSDRIERTMAAYKVDLASAAAGAQRIRVRLWVEYPCAGQDVSSYGFRLRNITLEGQRDQLRGVVIRDADQPAARTQHDALGRVVAKIGPDGAASRTAYDRATRRLTDANGVTRTHHLDARDRIMAIDETIDDAIATTHYFHRPATGELGQITDANGGVYTFAYDGLGRKVMEHDSDRGEWRTSYDTNGNAVRMQDANHNITRTEYDALGRPTRMVTHDNAETSYTYDAGANGVGRPDAIHTPDMSRHFAYDARGRTIRKTTAMDAHRWDTSFEYDDADRMMVTVYPDGEAVHVTHDARGFVTQVTGDDAYVTATTYTDYGKLTKLAYGNDTQLDYSYYDGDAVDPLSGSAYSYRLRTVAASGGTVDLSLEYQYDKTGNVLALLDRSADEYSQHFAYDTADRLVSAHGVYGERTYRYDAVGNLLTFDGRGYEYGQGNRLQNDGQWQYTYDDNGNVTARSQQGLEQRFVYDSLNRMVAFHSGESKESYRYDSGETRIKKVSGDKTTYYVSANYEEVWQGDERVEVVKHYRSGGQKVATRDEEGLKYVYPDHLASSSRMADTAGTQVKALWYTPFGGNAGEKGDAKDALSLHGQRKG